MSAKTKMKDYVTKMFSTKESTSSTDRLIASQISGLAAPSSVAPLLLHSLPISTIQHQQPSYNRVYRPTTVSIHSTHYDKVPTVDSSASLIGYADRHHRAPKSCWRNFLRSFRHSRTNMSGEGQLENNLRQAYSEGSNKELDGKHPSIQNRDEEESSDEGASRLGPQVLAALSVSMGSLAVGYASAYTSPASVSLLNSTDIEITATELSYIGGILPLAALVGGLLGGPLIDLLGRKTAILATAIPFIISWLLIGLATNLPMILSGRAIAGFCVGLTSLALPVYLGETVQPQVRGMLGLLPTAFGNTGILLAFTAGMFLDWWKLALAGTLVPIPFLLLMCVIPETPNWYLARGNREKALKSLQWLRGKTANVVKEFSEFEHTAQQNQKSDSSLQSLLTKANMKPVAITIGLMFFQQLSGVNAVIFYATKIFKDTGSTLDESICTIIIGCVNFASTFLATTVIDRMGRKLLLYISSISMTLTLGVLGTFMYLKDNHSTSYDLESYSYVPLVSLVLYIVGFSLGFGPIPWLMMGEILPAKIRGPSASLATAFNWACTSIVTFTFNDLVLQLGIGPTFWMFGVVCFIAIFFVIFCVPETRGKSLEDIERKFAKNTTRRMSSIANLRPSPMSV